MRIEGRSKALAVLIGLALASPGVGYAAGWPALGTDAAQARMRDIAARRSAAGSFDPVATLNRVYTAFLTGDAATLLDLSADDIVLEVVGPSERLPFYGTFHGKDGVLAFLYAAASTFAVEDLDVTYQVVDRQTVNAMFKERRRYLGSGAVAELQVVEETIFDAEGKIRYYRVLIDQVTELAAFGGAAGEVYRTSYPSTDLAAPGYARPPRYGELMAVLALGALSTGDGVALQRLSAPDAVYVFGNEGVASYSGRHADSAALLSLARAFHREIESVRIENVIGQGNKAAVNLVLQGRSAATGRTYVSGAAFTVQLRADGTIAAADLTYDQAAAYAASQDAPQ